jgi:hypothetical protein
MPPRFSVVIPTRERAHTLRSTLRTCLDQEFDDYEIIVCDNCSSPATHEVVESFASPRLRYIRAPQPLAMSDNWELALGQATGEYVTFLGDDDALLSHGLAEVDRVITRTGARAVRWVAVSYTWPSVALAGEGNYLAIPLMRELHTVDAVKAIDAVIGFRECYNYLPMIYHGTVHRELIAELRQRTGRVFLTTCPDVYSGFAFAYLAGTYASIQLPVSVCGLSGHSNGIATLLLREPSAVADEFHRLNAASARVGAHPTVPQLPIFPAVPVAESFQHARDALFPTDDRLRLDRRLLAEQYVAGLWAHDENSWHSRLAVIRATLADEPELQRWFDEGCGRTQFRAAPPPKLRGRDPGYDGTQLHLRADAFGVVDVAGAARLCEHLLGFRGSRPSFDLPGQPWYQAQLEQLQQRLARADVELAARLDAINKLDEHCRNIQPELDARLALINRLDSEFAQHSARIAAERAAREAEVAAQLDARLDAINSLDRYRQATEIERREQAERIRQMEQQLAHPLIRSLRLVLRTLGLRRFARR